MLHRGTRASHTHTHTHTRHTHTNTRAHTQHSSSNCRTLSIAISTLRVHSSILCKRLLHTNFRLQVNFYIPKANHFISQFMTDWLYENAFGVFFPFCGCSFSLCLSLCVAIKNKCRYFTLFLHKHTHIFELNSAEYRELSTSEHTILASPLHFFFVIGWNLLQEIGNKNHFCFQISFAWFHLAFCF